MKLLITILAFSVIGGAPTISNSQGSISNSTTNEIRIPSWAAIESYINNNASKNDSVVREMLHTEAANGIKTWTLNFFSPAIGLRDGGGIGWPAAGNTVTFPSSAQASTCADMIDDFTYSLKRK